MNKKLVALFAGAAMAIPMVAAAWAPQGDVTMIVAYKAGSGTDTGARLLAADAEKNIGQTLVVTNLPGAGGRLGWTQLTRAKPDGQTIGFINLPSFTTDVTKPGCPYKVTDVTPIVNHLLETGVVVVRADSPYQTLQQLVDAAKEKGNLRASTNGVEKSNHTAAQLLAKSAGFKYKAVPYGGTADQLLALRQGEVTFSCAKLGDVAKLSEGDNPTYRILGVFSPKRLSEFPNVPTLGELGFYPNWYGSARAIVAPKGTPKEVIDFYVEAFKKTMEDPATIARHEKSGLSMAFMDNEELADLIKKQEIFSRDEITQLYKK